MSNYNYRDHFRTSLSLGLYSNMSTKGYPGYNPTVTSATEVTLSPMGLGFHTTPPNSGILLQIRSTNSLDTDRIIICEVLNGQGLEVTTISFSNPTNATTPAFLYDLTTYQQTGQLVEVICSRINSVIDRTSTASRSLGDFLVETKGGGVVYTGFKAEDGRSQCCMYTLPADKTGLFLPADATMNKAVGADDSVIIRVRTRIKDGPWLNNGRWGLQKSGTSAFTFEAYDRPTIPAFTDIMITAQATAGDIDCSGRLSIERVSNTLR